MSPAPDRVADATRRLAEAQARLARVVKRMADGTVSGLSAAAAPVELRTLGDVDRSPGPDGGADPSATVVAETTYGLSSAPGVATTYSRGDHTHGSPVAVSPSGSVVSEQSFGQGSNIGVATTYSRGDHTHGTPSLSGTGGSPFAARSDHFHSTRVPAVCVSSTVEQGVGHNVEQGVSFTFSRWDNDFMWNGSTALVVQSAGLYDIGGRVHFTQKTGVEQRVLLIKVNGLIIVDIHDVAETTSGINYSTGLGDSRVWNCNVGDVITLHVIVSNNPPVVTNIQAIAAYTCELQATRVGTLT